MVVGGVSLALALIRLDLYLPGSAVEGYARLLTTSPEGARAILEAIAGSMVTVAGVVFSITIVTLSLASSQYSPRVLRGFMKDRTNQVVLGVFVGIFAYCIVVLGAIRTDVLTFVPSVAVLVAGVLSLVGIGFLIRFIHHTAVSIQASNIVSTVSAETLTAIDRVGRESPEVPRGAAERDDGHAGWVSVPAASTGYLQSVAHETLVDLAEREDMLLRAECRVGDFVIRGTPLLAVAGALAPPEEVCAEMNSAFRISQQRTVEQDPAWGVRQIADIAARALSPGINDTTTAVTCLHHLTAILLHVGSCSPPEVRHCARGRIRWIARAVTHAELAAIALDDVRVGARGNPTMLAALVDAIAQLAATPVHAAELCLRRHLEAVRETVEHTVQVPAERALLQQSVARAAARIDSLVPGVQRV